MLFFPIQALCRWALLVSVLIISTAAHAQPFVKIISPGQGQCVPGPDVTVHFEAGGFPIAPGSNSLHFMLDNDPFQVQFDARHSHTFKDVPPGTHTIRVYGADVMHQSIPGTLAVVTFSVAYADGLNKHVPGTPMLTYNLPQGEYLGIDAADIAVDFIVSNAAPGQGYQVAYYVDGRRFLVQDMCGPRHLKKLGAGYHRVRVELQDMNGDLIPGVFNRTERLILVSPDSLRKSTAGVPDHYPASLPRIPSIKGSMTMGNPWLAYETETRELGPAAIASQRLLTVRRKDEVVNLDGTGAKPFTVREGGAPDETVKVDSIRVESPAVESFSETETDVLEESIQLREEPVVPVSESNELVTTRVAVTRRDTSPAPVVKVTTGSLSQALRTTPETTATLRVQDPFSTSPTVRRTDNETTTGRNRRTSQGRDRDRESTRTRTRPEDVSGQSEAVGEE